MYGLTTITGWEKADASTSPLFCPCNVTRGLLETDVPILKMGKQGSKAEYSLGTQSKVDTAYTQTPTFNF